MPQGVWTHQDETELRALIHAAWPHRHGPRAAEYAQAIIDWWYLRPIARGDLQATKRLARDALRVALEQEKPPLTVDELVALFRRTDLGNRAAKYDESHSDQCLSGVA